MIGSEQTSTAVEGEIDRLPFLCFRDVFHKLFHLFGFAAISTLVVDDFNGDGLLDIAATDGFSELVIFMPGNGDGTFGPGTGFGGGLTNAAVAIDRPGFQPSIALGTELKQLRVVRNMTPAI